MAEERKETAPLAGDMQEEDEVDPALVEVSNLCDKSDPASTSEAAESSDVKPADKHGSDDSLQQFLLTVGRQLPADASTASLAGSFAPSETGNVSKGTSPLSSVSRRRRPVLKRDSTLQNSVGSSLNLSAHGGSIIGLHEDPSDDGFHFAGHTMISPMVSGLPSSIPMNVTRTQRMGRFSVSPAQSFSQSITHRQGGKRTPTGSESSTQYSVKHSPDLNRTSCESSMQFKMSETSLIPEELQGTPTAPSSPRIPLPNAHNEQQRPLLLDYFDVVDVRSTRHSTEIPEGKQIEMEDLEDLMYEVDENQRTVKSNISVNTQDSATYVTAPLQCGNIRFVKDSVTMPFDPKKHYLCVNYDTLMPSVTNFMATYWGMRNPNIVLSVISAEEHFKPWKSQRLKDDFQKGIIKTANTTDMWIITNGIDAGVPKIIGDAIKEFNIEQQNSRIIINPMTNNSEQRKKRPKVIGIVPKDLVPYGVYFDGTEGVQIRNMGQKPSAEIYELNPDHTHFIMVEEDGHDSVCGGLRCLIEDQFRRKHGHKKKIQRLMSIGSDSEPVGAPPLEQFDYENYIPVVGLLVQGMPRNIDQVFFYIQNKMPVVVLKGSGGIADIIGYTFEELQEKAESDPDYEEHILKPELTKMIMRQFASHFEDNDIGKFALRDRIIQCCKMATEGEGDNTYMTVVNMKGWGSSMKDLDKYILRALFKSEKREGLGVHEQFQNDLQLTIDWNRPDLAWEIFQQDFTKVRIDKKMFEKALLQKDREEFIDLFLTQGVRVHKFLNHKKLKLLFEKADDREFFINICLEGVLGISVVPDQPLNNSFLSESLNRLIYKLSWLRNFIQPFELSMCSVGLNNMDSAIAERKAILCLVIWAVLMNRHKLAKTLWNRCDEPIGVALICSRIYKEMTKYNMEQYQRSELEENAKQFGEMALGALAICWRDSSVQAYHMLGRRLTDFNNKSVIEIAHDAGYIHFLAHPCCQKWLTKKFFGHLQVKELDWGFGRLPYWFKILVSVFFIFPMYIWITFIPPSKKKTPGHTEFPSYFYTKERQEDSDSEGDENDDEDEEEEDDILPHVTESTLKGLQAKKSDSIGIRLKSAVMNLPQKGKRHVPFHQKIYLLWTAPITKFWTTQVFYFAFLGVFSLATIWPTCGNQYLDMTVWLWTMIIELELVWRVYRKYHRYKTLSLVGNCMDILIIMAFLVILLLTRILHVWVGLSNYMQARTFMCYGLIYFFYRLLGIYLPISPTLGPMLLRISRMIKHDFVAFVRMFLIFMIVGGVTIQAVLYPHWPLSIELVKRVITRPIYAMFLTQVADLDGEPCSSSYENTTDYCYSGSVNSEAVQAKEIESLQKCPHTSLSAYVITLQYLLICKLVLVTLLFAMFALTIAKVDLIASEIWKFQRYSLIADFIERFSLPPPFTFLSMIYLVVRTLFRMCKKKLKKCCRKNKDLKLRSMHSRIGQRAIDDTLYWKKVAREYNAGEEAKQEKENMPQKQGDILVSLQDDLRTYRKSMKRLNDRIVELERMFQSSSLCLEDIAHKLEKNEVMGITNVKGRFIHVAARQSPYPSTTIARFPVFDKYVPWDTQYDVYDPKTYTLEKSKFLEHEIFYVDEDILELARLKEERDDDGRMSPITEFFPKWNTVTTTRDKNVRQDIDRLSWINIDDQPLRYEVDALNLPQNPMGRTGIRGKGILWRWGPNHVIKAVVTRWRRKYGPDLSAMTDYLYVEGKRVLEFITVQKETFMDSSYALPGDILHGLNNPYSILCQSFMSQVFNEEDTAKQYGKFDQRDMIQFFSQFASVVVGGSTSRTSVQPMEVTNPVSNLRSAGLMNPYITDSRPNLRSEVDQQGFCSTLLYKGYLDDPRNTDNAWVEAEVWNFHYDLGDSFDLRMSEELTVKWKEVSKYVKIFGNESVIVQEAARIHDAYC
ncbi:transient receptor potential cation channel subfamily M member 2-like isoform X1 [Mya arenaria]|uniref:transient receptor potential cation channel subfamily M member 2-like isoform X1 n=1 Tax=Mya arenaria TaxID=6604 RepID=UPI0022E7E300|nr:transient receptor potential cation channel subfamily M member 2-like isoform X1 [Mya arenaria]XP_052792597.1 transient receptor potential cation channel subfamily M member 2-like isoform X1 [Mya arenaria]XP_052792598.1 transient receptor potential cation channel subfamily M member 2-like isoform X1 [Mya arenaria]XP_052792599.1 transient receptor potential cation channel subfamily M member 2-like isoform X1 [Mya arenaria]XP_052792600.1 transient receptor potential cation channel subfamily M 